MSVVCPTYRLGDIAGFSFWASSRDPAHVFTLLETVYAAFDAIAKQKRVYSRFYFRVLCWNCVCETVRLHFQKPVGLTD